MIEVVYPSAGHHDKDPGAVANDYKEADLTKELRDLMAVEFKRRNHKIIMDKDHETNRQYQSRIKPGNGSVVMDLHFNAASPSVSGVEIFVHNNASKHSVDLATEICQMISTLLGIPNRGVKRERQSQHRTIGILRTKAGISVLVEVCFITNANDMKKYQKHKKELALKLVELAIKYDDLI